MSSNKRKAAKNAETAGNKLKAAKSENTAERSDAFKSIFNATQRSTEDFAGIRADLDEHGLAVVVNVLGDVKKQAFVDSFWTALERRQPKLSRADQSTWTEKNLKWYGTYGAGQYKHYGMAQEAHCWMIRLDPTIRAIFERGVYADEEQNPSTCCVSLDGAAAIFEPAESGLKAHVDVVPGLPECNYPSVQCSYNALEVRVDEPTGRYGAGFVCVPGSHHGFKERWAARTQNNNFKKPTKHWYTLEETSPLQRECCLVPCPADSLVLWRSELIHRNYGGDFSCEDLQGPCRMTQFVTWHPTKYRSEKTRQKKIKVVAEGKSLNHWAAGNTMTVPIKPFPAWGEGSNAIKCVVPVKKVTEEMLNVL